MVSTADLSCFRGAKVFVTGDTGFKGSWLTLWLSKLGATVTGYALPPEHEQSHFTLLDLDRVAHHIDGDVCDAEALKSAVSDAKPDFVFHLAAQSLLRRSFSEPQATFATNVLGSVNLLEAVRSAPSVRALIYVTSDKCYLNKEWTWGYRENDQLGGHDPYSGSKAAAEMAFASYFESFFKDRAGFGCASVRAGNVIGGGDTAPDRIVPDAFRALSQGKPIVLRSPRATRPWQFVLEPLHGYLALAAALDADADRFSGSWNFGPAGAASHTVDDLAHAIVECWGEGSVRHDTDAGGPPEAGLLHLSIDKARQILGWSPAYDFKRTVSETTRWYKAFHEGADSVTSSNEQIDAFADARGA